jgi:2-phosphosulfolactate phosphatase
VVVDVFSFSTSVDVAVSQGAVVYPYFSPSPAADYAREIGALLAGDNPFGYSLHPSSLTSVQAGTRLVLPSYNGAALSLLTGQVTTFAGCLRNARAVARAAAKAGERVGVVAAGERWDFTTLRPAFEDLLGAGAVIQSLHGSRSPEAEAAQIAFQHFENRLETALLACASGQEMLGAGRESDVQLAAALNASATAPRLIEGAYRQT